MAPVTTYDNQVCPNLLREQMDLCFRSPEYQMTPLRWNIKRRRESRELDLGCVMKLVLNGC